VAWYLTSQGDLIDFALLEADWRSTIAAQTLGCPPAADSAANLLPAC
jgi:hypothetical protein